ncbi:aldehyde dehydrogenase [Candidatus Photodesmus katoptron]|uniref:coniferyl aldehyde dehydrogenase n=1 Tax=Candidatus Photodesmus anomalopis TaxID=28176 RepID=UPI0004D837A3|nr:coniferyl aldehyde dehydrogenase [Candidatus Photodesmus katoptron]KEY90599.1 aldehyde dehydrogenase [Candidatus Photodesmus katoptron]
MEKKLRKIFCDMQLRAKLNPNPDYITRINKLRKLKRALLNKKTKLVQSIRQDYGFRSPFDSLICDILPAVNHINYTISRLRSWMKPSSRSEGILLFPSKTQVYYQPLGIIGIMVPWNFPIVLSLSPVVTAIAAGNLVMVKLSEYTHNTNNVLSIIFASLCDEIQVVEGDSKIAELFSNLPFNHLIFTGSTKIGRLVAQSAAKNLTPVTLELGGKSPVIISDDAKLNSAVNIVMMGKSINSGQICVSPDYIFIPESKKNLFVDLYLKQFKDIFITKKSKIDLTYIINDIHYQRLKRYLDNAKLLGADIHTFDEIQPNKRQMLPHLVTNVNDNMILMQEEIFGPILPVIGYNHIDEAFRYVNNKPRPLVLYLISNRKILRKKVIEQTYSGGVCFNDTLLHCMVDDAPFGGIGDSGIGQYHGIEGFKAFSQAKTVFSTPNWFPRSHVLLNHKAIIQKILNMLFLR